MDRFMEQRIGFEGYKVCTPSYSVRWRTDSDRVTKQAAYV